MSWRPEGWKNPCGGLEPSWATSWHVVVVGVGLLKGWYYDIYYDSSC